MRNENREKYNSMLDEMSYDDLITLKSILNGKIAVLRQEASCLTKEEKLLIPHSKRRAAALHFRRTRISFPFSWEIIEDNNE